MKIEGRNVDVTLNVAETEQEINFMNATLQSVCGKISFSVASYLDVPCHVIELGQHAVAKYILDHLQRAAGATQGLIFDVQVGPARAGVVANVPGPNCTCC